MRVLPCCFSGKQARSGTSNRILDFEGESVEQDTLQKSPGLDFRPDDEKLLHENDDIYEDLGRYSWRQLRHFLIVCIVALPTGFSAVSPVVVDFAPDFKCHSSHTPIIVTDPVCGHKSEDTCHVIKNGAKTDCDGDFNFKNNTMIVTTVTEFDLVCKMALFATFVTSAYYMGTIIVPLVVSSLADTYGRRKMIIVLLLMQAVSVLVASFATTWWFYSIFRIIEGGVVLAVVLISVTLIYETTSPGYVSASIAWFYTIWAAGFYLLILSSLFLRKWRQLLQAEAAYAVLAAICVMFADESPLYNISKGNFDKAFKFYRRIATSNRLKLSDSWKEKLKINANLNQTNLNFSHLFRQGRRMNIILIIVGYTCFVNGLTQFGLTLNSVNLPLSLRASFAAVTLTNFPGNYIFYICTERYGRKYSNIVLLATAGVLLLVADIFRNLAGCDMGTADQFKNPYTGLSLAAVLLGQVAANASANLFIGVYVQELFPTPVRSSANMWAASAMGCGVVAAPVALQVLPYQAWLPISVMGILALFGAGALCLLPDTAILVKQNRTLNTLAEAHEFYENG